MNSLIFLNWFALYQKLLKSLKIPFLKKFHGYNNKTISTISRTILKCGIEKWYNNIQNSQGFFLFFKFQNIFFFKFVWILKNLRIHLKQEKNKLYDYSLDKFFTNVY